MKTIIKTGQHRMTHASIEESIVDELLAQSNIDILYTDPPWGDRMVKWFAKLNEKQTGFLNSVISFDALLSRIFSLSKQHVTGYLCIECGKQSVESLAKRFQDEGLYQPKIIQSHYAGRRTCFSIVAGMDAAHPVDPVCNDIKDLTGAAVSKEIIGRLKPYISPDGNVFDPCCGMGFTARAAVAHGLTFYGNEVNALRLQKTIDYLSRTKPVQSNGAI